MTNRDILLAAVSGEKVNRKAAAWIRKAGGMKEITEEMAARIVKLCRLGKPEQERHEM